MSDVLTHLRECPFCGAEAVLVEAPLEACWYIECSGCTCRFGGYSSRLDMIPAWNQRAPAPKSVRATLTAIVRYEIEQEGRTPALVEALEWLRAQERASDGEK